MPTTYLSFSKVVPRPEGPVIPLPNSPIKAPMINWLLPPEAADADGSDDIITAFPIRRRMPKLMAKRNVAMIMRLSLIGVTQREIWSVHSLQHYPWTYSSSLAKFKAS